jgi:hypothetical protein
MKNKFKINESSIGRYCTVKFLDSGYMDGVIVSFNGSCGTTSCICYLKVYLLATMTLDTVELDQIVDLRGYIKSDRK